MSEKQTIFLSAVSGQFKDCRDALRDDLEAVGAEVKVQENFQQGSGTLLEKLEHYIADCDRVIALVGSAYGAQPDPSTLPEGTPVRSYTQWEYYFAQGERLNGEQATPKPVYVYFASPDYLAQLGEVPQPAIDAQRQQQFIQAIEASNKDRNAFDSLNHLARLVLRDGFRLDSARTHQLLLHNLPYDSLGSLFKGRDQILKNIKTNLSTTANTERATAIVAKQAIHGLGGVGKTRLAVEYAWQTIADYEASLFVIADAPDNLARNLAELCSAEILNLPEQAATEQEVQVAAVLHWLKAHTDWLLILDNVDSPEAAAAVEALLPQLQRGHVLITSRRAEWGNSVHRMPLDILKEDDAVAFLLDKTTARTITEQDEHAAHTLATTLDGLALALEQAGAFINKMHLSFEQYQTRWEEQEAKLREFPVKDYSKPLAVTWETSFAQLTTEAQQLLNLLCWFAPEPIPREIFAKAYTTIMDVLRKDDDSDDAVEPPDLEDLLAELEGLSLLKWELGQGSFSVHRLVQDITQGRLTEAERDPLLTIALALINEALPSDPPPDDVRSWWIWEPLHQHVNRVIAAADAAGITTPTARVMNELAVYLKAKGLFGEAEPLMRRVLAIDEASYGANHPTVAIRLNNLAQLLRTTNQLAEAEPLLRRTLAIDEASYGADHPDVAIDLNNLALLLQDTNRLADAEPLMRRALAIFETSFGEGHPDVATLLNNLAQLLKATNQFTKAEPLYRRALAIDEASFGKDHPKIATDLNNLALLLQDTNRLEKAEPLARRVVEILLLFVQRTGHEHPHLYTSLGNYGGLLSALGHSDEQVKATIDSLIESIKHKASAG